MADPRELLNLRQMKLEAFRTGPRQMLLVGHLADTYSHGVVNRDGTLKPAGKMHDMRIELEVTLPDLTVIAASAEISHAPEAACSEVAPVVQQLVGLQIRRGFARDVGRVLGGARGCHHLRELVAAMAPMAIPAADAASAGQPTAQRLARGKQHLLDSCYAWRADLPTASSPSES